ncbi:hypothetical protein [Thalassoroseus pseudoceratinae]|uniref:hypothetical protein n=1 Tax=Thalassoroseus pseudoceratinae TaxID=2713176 RepID=UPI00141FAB3D|nr:hypothetical protein [Thalassoroseus pseudoceratinae]
MERTGLVGERPTQGKFELFAAEIVAVGGPDRSVLFYRMATLACSRILHIGSCVIDAAIWERDDANFAPLASRMKS